MPNKKAPRLRGTSMATPATTGIMALWLQQNPQLRYDSALVLIRTSARTDSFTGALPSSGSNPPSASSPTASASSWPPTRQASPSA